MALLALLLAVHLAAPPTVQPLGAHAATPFPAAFSLITVGANATAPERHAAQTLADYLSSIILIHTGDQDAVVVVSASAATASRPQLALGYAAARLLGAPAAAFDGLGREGYIMYDVSAGTSAASLALSGGPGAPRGTLYAVDEFLEAVGVEFLAADVTLLPEQLPPSLPKLRPRYVPKLEYRQTVRAPPPPPPPRVFKRAPSAFSVVNIFSMVVWCGGAGRWSALFRPAGGGSTASSS
jgi:hypothetical protein